MSARLLLRAVVNERLTAAAEEIIQVFERTIVKYEEEPSSSKLEIERLRCLLLESNQRTGGFILFSHLSVSDWTRIDGLKYHVTEEIAVNLYSCLL